MTGDELAAALERWAAVFKGQPWVAAAELQVAPGVHLVIADEDGTEPPGGSDRPSRKPAMTAAERARAYRERKSAERASRNGVTKRDGPRDEFRDGRDGASRKNVTVRDGLGGAPPPSPHPSPSRSSALSGSSGSESSSIDRSIPSREASRTSRESRDGKRDGRDVTAVTVCPPDLDLTEGQKVALEMNPGIPRATIAKWLGEERGAMAGRQSKRMPLEQWRVYFSKIICGRWNAGERPSTADSAASERTYYTPPPVKVDPNPPRPNPLRAPRPVESAVPPTDEASNG